MKKNEPEDSPELKLTVKRPSRVVLATRHLVKQRLKALLIRDKAIAELEQLDAALLALGYPE
jgi:hypothetical protein